MRNLARERRKSAKAAAYHERKHMSPFKKRLVELQKTVREYERAFPPVQPKSTRNYWPVVAVAVILCIIGGLAL